MKILAIGDIHEAPNIAEIEATISKVAPDTTVFLGDYFDQWYDTPEDARRTAEWLKWSIERPRRIHLWGNHDLPYALLGRCPGWRQDKHEAVRSVIPLDGWSRMRLWHRIGRWLFTHAGLSKTACPPLATPDDLEPMLQREEALAWERLHQGQPHWIWGIGAARGGESGVGGILWCDLAEFRPLRGINQVFGHTPMGRAVRIPGRYANWCIDTSSRTGVSQALVIDDRDSHAIPVGQHLAPKKQPDG